MVMYKYDTFSSRAARTANAIQVPGQFIMAVFMYAV